MIRKAEKGDLISIRKLIILDVSQRNWDNESGIETDHHSIDVLLRKYIGSSYALVLVSQTEDFLIDGYFVGELQPYLLNIKQMAAHEKMSGGENVSQMWDHFKEWARNHSTMKASLAVLGCYNNQEGTRFRGIQ